MTARELYEGVLVEVNKESAQSFTVEEFNKVLNKVILAFSNNAYEFYATNQRLTDDLKALHIKHKYLVEDQDVTIDPTASPLSDQYNEISGRVVETVTVSGTDTVKVSTTRDLNVGDQVKFKKKGEVMTVDTIVSDTEITVTSQNAEEVLAGSPILKLASPLYLDSILTGRVLELELDASNYFHMLSCRVVVRSKKPKTEETVLVTFPAKRLTEDMHNAIETNTYLRPATHRPYYKVLDNELNSGVVSTSDYEGQANKPVIEIHLGEVKSNMEVVMIEIDYLKLPEHIELKDSDVYTYNTDPSQVLEFPEYLRNEFINKCATNLLERERDPRVQTQPMLSNDRPSTPLNIELGASGKSSSDPLGDYIRKLTKDN